MINSYLKCTEHVLAAVWAGCNFRFALKSFICFLILPIFNSNIASSQHCSPFQIVDTFSIISRDYNKRHTTVRHASLNLNNGSLAITLDSHHWLSINLKNRAIDACMPFDTLKHDEMNFIHHDSLEPNKLYLTKSNAVYYDGKTYRWDHSKPGSYSI